MVESSTGVYRNQMAKTGRAPKLREVEPEGPITLFPNPVKVEFRINWESPFHNPDGDMIQSGWAIGYTSTAGHVVWLLGEELHSAWLPADHIRRR